MQGGKWLSVLVAFKNNIIVNYGSLTIVDSIVNVLERSDTNFILGCHFYTDNVETTCPWYQIFKLQDSTAVQIINDTSKHSKDTASITKDQKFRNHIGHASRKLCENETIPFYLQCCNSLVLLPLNVKLNKLKFIKKYLNRNNDSPWLELLFSCPFCAKAKNLHRNLLLLGHPN